LVNFYGAIFSLLILRRILAYVFFPVFSEFPNLGAIRKTLFLAGNAGLRNRLFVSDDSQRAGVSRPFNRRIAHTLDANPAWQPNTRDDSNPVITRPPDVRNTRTAW